MAAARPEHDVDALLDRALSLPPAERTDYIEHSCSGDPALLRRLLHLVDLAARDDGYLDRSPLLASPMSHDECASDTAGGTLGAYRLVRRIGVGGMGEVWLGERVVGGFSQRVAIKRLRVDNATGIARFDAERDILAALEHPGIARLYDGGIADDGRPYMVMEFVEGEDLLAHCIANATPLHGRLRLFLDVCAAVAYAHAHLVIHRDLKPANVMVTRAGRVKLLDFGIAKLLQADRVDDATRTAHLSPAYAAPEQLTGGRVGTAADVHALGVTLYQILTARLPWPVDDLPLGIAVERLLHSEHIAPSRLAPDPRAVPPRALRGDLDAIVAKALRREPEARYPDARALGDDIERYLAHEPVRARSGARAYVARRFVRRHWVPIAMMSGLVLALGAAAIYAGLAQQRTQAALRRADAVRTFVVELFEQNDPAATEGRVLSARELVDLGAKRVESGLQGDVHTRIELLGVIGTLYRSLGDYPRSAELLSHRLTEATHTYAPDDPRRIDAQLDAADVLVRSERFDAARELVDAAIAQLPRERIETRALRTRALELRAEVEFNAGNPVLAGDIVRDTLAELRDVPDTPPKTRVSLLASRGAYAYTAGQVAASEPPLREALAQIEALDGEKTALLLDIRSALARTLTSLGRFDEAARFVQANVEAIERVYGTEHPKLADAIFQLGSIARMNGDPKSAVVSYRRALVLYEKKLGPNHSYVATTLGGLGQALGADGRHAEAIDALKRARQIYVDALGPKHGFTVASETALATAMLEAGDVHAAETGFRTALAAYAGIGDGHHIHAEAARLGLGDALVRQRRYAEAEPLLREARRRLGDEFGADDYRTVSTTIVLARCLAASERRDEARALLEGAADALATSKRDVSRERDRVDVARREIDGR